MRDDLHKTVPLARPWGRVLRRLSHDRWSSEELAPLIVSTVQNDLAADDKHSGQALDDTLREGCSDLFDDGEEKMRFALHRILDCSLSVATRTTCEIALGVLATYGMSPSFRQQVTQAVGEQHARDQFEHMASRIACTWGYEEASQVRGVLARALELCDFTAQVRRPARRTEKSKSVGEFLSTELQLGQ
ncbi:hypothetical protein [Paraburkholderia agricolaris]|uniref:hypothetical protein n=1 Tax=Paraburkholderia agricolaris TaxID=2152888 RepID=UPI001C2C1714|nr:hypothetical protein [Paraburkholderia agricolaris]